MKMRQCNNNQVFGLNFNPAEIKKMPVVVLNGLFSQFCLTIYVRVSY